VVDGFLLGQPRLAPVKESAWSARLDTSRSLTSRSHENSSTHRSNICRSARLAALVCRIVARSSDCSTRISWATWSSWGFFMQHCASISLSSSKPTSRNKPVVPSGSHEVANALSSWSLRRTRWSFGCFTPISSTSSRVRTSTPSSVGSVLSFRACKAEEQLVVGKKAASSRCSKAEGVEPHHHTPGAL
jgi:hypothetical protein